MQPADHLQNIPFERRVDHWVAVVLENQPANFLEILRSLPGVYPSAALASLRRLHRAGALSTAVFRMLEIQATTFHDLFPVDPRLPPPHPLNYEWWFTSNGVDAMMNAAFGSSAEGDNILMLGTPGVARNMLRERPARRLTFLGEDNHVTRLLAIENERTGSPIQIRLCGAEVVEGQADVVLLDPPWYTDFICPMLRTAAVACRTGGHILFSLAPIGANRSAYLQRAQVFELASSLGLQTERLEEAALSYETPYFEANALRAAGLSAPVSWRTADLVVFRKESAIAKHADSESVNSGEWADILVGRMRVFVRRGPPASLNSSFLLQPVVRGEVLPSVSRHDPRRRGVDVWTSGNRIFRCSRPDLVVAAAELPEHSAATLRRNASNASLPAEIDALVRLNYCLHRLAARETVEERGTVGEAEAWIEDSTFLNSSLTSRATRGG